MDDDNNPLKPGGIKHILGSDLSTLSVSEIGEVISELEEEITRLKGEKSRKSASLDAADSFFNKSV